MNDPNQRGHSDLAAGMYEIETLRAKLVIGRILGIVIGLAIWWFVIGPMGNTYLTIGAFFVVIIAGLWLGQMVTLSIVRGRR